MFLQKLTKSCSNPLPVYEPLSSSHYPGDGTLDHEAGSFSCAYSPQHSVGAACVVVQSAEIHKPKGWLKRWFGSKPRVWVIMKVLGRTMGTVDRKGGDVKTWREKRTFAKVSSSEKSDIPSFDLISHYALIGPYEKELELEVRNSRSWWRPSQRPGFLGSTTFTLPSDFSFAPAARTTSHYHRNDQLQPPASYHTSHHMAHTDDLQRRQPAHVQTHANSSLSSIDVPLSRSISSVPVDLSQESRWDMEHEDKTGSPDDGAEGCKFANGWVRRAPIFNKDLERAEGTLLFNVFWYPAIHSPFPHVTHVQGRGAESKSSLAQPMANAGVVSFTLHSLDNLGSNPERQVVAAVSLGWHHPPLHTFGGTISDILKSKSRPSVMDESTESIVLRREDMLRRRLSGNQDLDDGTAESKQFDATFEFLCFQPSSTNLVIKVYEIYRRGPVKNLGIRQKVMIGHSSFPLIDVVGSPESDGTGGGRDKSFPLLGHPSAKARVCVEWRGLGIPEAPESKKGQRHRW